MLSLLFASAVAATYDPDLTWYTLHTEHFNITFHQGEEQIAAEMAEAMEEAWTVLVKEIGTEPRQKVEMTLIDWTDSANGYATGFPYNTIVIFVTTPKEDSTLSYYESWSKTIGTHELTHVFEMATVRGLPQIGRWVFGSIISTHNLAPRWIVEGYATYQETLQTYGGRGEAPLADMVKRSATLEGYFPRLGNLDGYQTDPPGGNLRYLFGQDFIQYIADRSGSEKWKEWVQRYGASLPFLLHGRQTFGAPFRELYDGWKAEATRRYTAQAEAVKAEGVTTFRVLSDPDESCTTPAYTPDGSALVYACNDPRSGSRMWKTGPNGEDPKILMEGRMPDHIVWRPDGRAFAWSEIRVQDLYSSFEDIYLYNLDDKSTTSMTRGARARDPSFSPDGSRMVMVTNGLQNNQLAVLTVDQRLTPLTDNTDHTVYGTPRFSPDGQRIALSVWKEGFQDLWLYTPDGKPLRRLTWDKGLDRDPAWSPDGRYLFFSSERSGIPNIYALDLEQERLYRVTNVVSGAFGPSVRADGKVLAFQHFTTPGTQIALLDIDPSTWKDVGALPIWPEQPMGSLLGALPSPEWPSATAAPTPEKEEEDKEKKRGKGDLPDYPFEHPVSHYNPWPTLLPPRFWLPAGGLTYIGDAFGLYGVAATGGTDKLHFFSYSGWLTYRTDANFFGGGGSVSLLRWRPVLSVGASTDISPYGSIYVNSTSPGGPFLPGVEDSRTRYWDQRLRAYVSAAYPVNTRASVSGYYRALLRQPLDPLPEDPYYAFLPTRGFFSTIGGGYSYGYAKSYTYSISPEDGHAFAIGAEFTPAFLGSVTYDDNNQLVPFTQLQTTAEWREYQTNPWIPNHVFAGRIAGGATFGDKFRYGSYRLGGTWSESGIAVVPDEWRSLRGFYPASASGEWFWMGSGEYRFPISRINRGLGLWPLFFHTLSGAVFVDAGNAFDAPEDLRLADSLVGAGAELRLLSVIGYGGGLYSRLGYGFSVMGDGVPVGSLSGLYLLFGTSF